MTRQRREPKFNKRYRSTLLLDAMGGGLCAIHGAYFGHGKYGLRDCPFCDIEEYFKKEETRTQLAQWTPRTWKAGECGGKVINFGCCKCGAELLAGAAFKGETFCFESILVIPAESGLYNLALYCQEHLPEGSIIGTR